MSMSGLSGSAPSGQRRPRPRFRPVEVRSVEPLAARMVRVVLGGDDLEGFGVEMPTQHIKVAFPLPGELEPRIPQPGPDGSPPPPDQPRPVIRTYTPRYYDPETRALTVDFVIHGEGPASEWAERARPGDRLAVAGPGGRFQLGLEPARYVVAGDESALPAIGTLLDALPRSAEVDVLVEVVDEGDHLDLARPAQVTWLHRGPRETGGRLLEQALRAADLGR
ncbi:MAG: siderophore-interacting protein, partial [Acidimicrobiales bacterium]|nr:siderophore-interacting protein [Acidimicrobiales bacterium]